jgi:hypothetical protein
MIGDHHGWTAGRAILLVRAVDEILGTHTTGAIEARSDSPRYRSHGAAGRSGGWPLITIEKNLA